MAFKFSRGVWVKDLITGFKGVIVSRSDSLTGCNRYCIQPEVDKEGKYIEAGWYDEHSIEIDNTRQKLSLDRTVDQPPG